MPDSDPETQLKTLIDRAAVTDLVARLGAWLDDDVFDHANRLFAEDVSARTPGGTAAGLEQVVDQARRRHIGVRTQHLITNVLVDVDGDQASARANLFVRFAAETGELEDSFSMGGRYRFEAVRSAQGWRLRRVELTPVWSTRPLSAPADSAA